MGLSFLLKLLIFSICLIELLDVFEDAFSVAVVILPTRLYNNWNEN